MEESKFKDLINLDIKKRRIETIANNYNKHNKVSDIYDNYKQQNQYYKMHIRNLEENQNKSTKLLQDEIDALKEEISDFKISAEENLISYNNQIMDANEEHRKMFIDYNEMQVNYKSLTDEYITYKDEAQHHYTQYIEQVTEYQEKFKILEQYTGKLIEHSKEKEDENSEIDKLKCVTVQDLKDRFALLSEKGKIPLALGDLRKKNDALSVKLFEIETINSQLKSRQENTILLKEKLRNTEKRKDILEDQVYELNKTKQLYDEMIITDKPSLNNISYVEFLEKKNVLNLNNCSKMKLTHESLLKNMAKVEKKNLESNQYKINLDHKLKENAAKIRKDDIEICILKKKCKGYESLIQSYENGDTVNKPSNENSDNKDLIDKLNASEYEIGKCNKSIHELYKENDTIKNQSLQLSEKHIENISTYNDVITNLKKKILRYSNENVELSKRLEKTETDLERLVLQGHYDPTKEKVLHFTNNPSSIAQRKLISDLVDYKTQNIKLQSQLSKIANRFADRNETLNCTDRDQSVLQIISVSDLQTKLEAEEKKNLKILEAFRDKLEKFRVGCYKLTGYEIKLKQNSYTLQSVYSNMKDDYLSFKEFESGEMILLENDYALSIKDDIDLYLKRYNSIPAFLASQTIKLHKDTTVVLYGDSTPTQ